MTVGRTTSDGAPDVVYLVRAGDDNDELRWSLRSLVNVEHGRVWLAGFQPSWTVNVGRIPVRQLPAQKYRSIWANLEAVCDADVAERFVLMNDDMFAMRPTSPSWTHRGSWDDVLAGYRNRSDEYTGLLRKAAQRWPDGVCYDSTHRPTPMERGRLRDVVDDRRRTLWKSDYGNLHRVGGRKVGDVKVKSGRVPKTSWLSTNDRSWSSHPVGQMIRRRFPDPSPYEVV